MSLFSHYPPLLLIGNKNKNQFSTTSKSVQRIVVPVGEDSKTFKQLQGRNS